MKIAIFRAKVEAVEVVKMEEAKAVVAARMGDKGLLLRLLKTIKVIVKVVARVVGIKVVVEVITGQKKTTNGLILRRSKSGSSIMIKMTVGILIRSYNRPHSKILASHSGIKTSGRTSGIIMCKKMIAGIKSTKMKAGLLRR